jgi:hypothetical protein
MTEDISYAGITKAARFGGFGCGTAEELAILKRIFETRSSNRWLRKRPQAPIFEALAP